MRLTLRTMLAFLDDMLDPNDSEEVGHKIEESDFAKSQIYRIRDVTRRLRLGTPRLEGKGIGLDANTVAEYLESTLPSDRVTDFEKVCLESDIHLAEVASVHQILTLVLGEPASVLPESRERMYGIIKRPEVHDAPRTEPSEADSSEPRAAQRPRDAAASPSADAGNAKRRKKKKPFVLPDYLRDKPRPRRKRWLAIAVVLVLLGVTGTFMAGGPGPAWDRLASLFGNRASGDGDTTRVADGSTPSRKSPQKNKSPRKKTSSGTRDTSKKPANSTSSRKPSAKRRVSRPETNSAADQADESNAIQEGDASDDDRDQQPILKTPGDKQDGARARTTTDEEAPEPPDPGEGGDDASADDSAVKSDGSSESDETNEQGKTQLEAPSAVALGRLISEHEVLVRFTNASQRWDRISDRGTVRAGDRILALETFGPRVALGTVTVQLLGGTVVELEPADDLGILGLRVLHGRLIVFPNGKPGAQLHIQAAGQRGTLVFDDFDATVAIEVQRSRDEGSDPSKDSAVETADLYVKTGEVGWRKLGNAKLETIQAPTRLSLVAREVADAADAGDNSDGDNSDGDNSGGDNSGGASKKGDAASGSKLDKNTESAKTASSATPKSRVRGKQAANQPQAKSEFPDWITSQELGQIEKRASLAIEEQLRSTDRAASLVLKELATDRRVEVRGLAITCLSQVGEFDPLITMLNDVSHRAIWPTCVVGLRTALANDPLSHLAIRRSLEKHRGPKAAELYRMLWGYNNHQLTDGGGAKALVEYLEHEDLDFRELAFWNLQQITGASHYYEPQAQAKKREVSIKKWREKLERHEIVHRPPPQ